MSEHAPTPKELADFAAREERRLGQKSAKNPGIEWEEVLKVAQANLPEVAPPLPYEMTEEGKRMALFRALCPAEYMTKIDRAQLQDPAAFDQVAQWGGRFKGLIAVGPTGTCKTRAAWSALGRLFVKENRTFAWFPVKRLVTEFEKFESKGAADEFWYAYYKFDALFIDDIDKINWQFDTQTAALWQFYDWIYRTHRACITTTNRDRAWWTNKIGDAFARRIFEDAMTSVEFK